MTPTELLLPELYRRTPEDAELQRVLAWMMARVEQDKDFTLEQLFPSTATGWGLELWEPGPGASPSTAPRATPAAPGQDRPKVKGTGTTTLEVIRAIAQSFSPYRAEVVEEAELYRFVVWYLGTVGEVAHKEDLIAAVNELKPAHLDWEIKYKQTQDSPIYVGAFPRQGDTMILWEVDCKHDT